MMNSQEQARIDAMDRDREFLAWMEARRDEEIAARERLQAEARLAARQRALDVLLEAIGAKGGAA